MYIILLLCTRKKNWAFSRLYNLLLLFFSLCKSWRVRPLYNLPNQMFFHIISDGWNVQKFRNHLILSKPLSRVSPDLLICYVLPCLKLWLIFAILNPFHRVTFFSSMSLIVFPIAFCFQFFLCLVFWFCFFHVWRGGWVWWVISGWTYLSLEGSISWKTIYLLRS